MLKESLPSILVSMYGWFTPAVLFVVLNVVIGTIAVSSKVTRSQYRDDEVQHEDHRRIQRVPSVLERLKSFNIYRYRSGDIPVETAAPSVLERLKSFNIYRYRSGDIPVETAAPAVIQPKTESVFETLDEAYEAAVSQEHHFVRSQSDPHPTAGEIQAKRAEKLKKSASAKLPFAHFEEVEMPRAPESVRELRDGDRAGQIHKVFDEEVDARADDFISRFRQQLKMQRLDSITRYMDMLKRGK